jgi:hypothetical protein
MGFDADLFTLHEDPEDNPSVLSSGYFDWHPPLKTTEQIAARLVKEIYAIPANCQHCLGGGELILRQSSQACQGGPFFLFSPIHFHVFRNTSPRSLFNLVKTGVLTMTTPTCHSPLSFDITNVGTESVQVYLPTGSIFELGTGDGSFVLITGRSLSHTLTPGARLTLQPDCPGQEVGEIVNSPMATFASGLGFTGSTVADLAMYDLRLAQALTGVNARPRRMHYYLTPFITLDATIQTPAMPMMVDYPPCPVEYGMEHLMPPNCRILRGFPCRRQLDMSFLSKGSRYMKAKVLYHAGELIMNDRGDYFIIEKMKRMKRLPAGLIHGEQVHPIEENGVVSFRNAKGFLYTVHPGENCNMKGVPTYKELLDFVKRLPSYDVEESNCQTLPIAFQDQYGIDAPQSPGNGVLFSGLVEFGRQTLEDIVDYFNELVGFPKFD